MTDHLQLGFVQMAPIWLQRQERQNFDPAGHYSRPDVTQLHVNRERQRTVRFTGGSTS